MSKVVGTFYINESEVLVRDNSTYEFPSFRARNMGPAMFNFNEEGDLLFHHTDLEGNITSSHFLEAHNALSATVYVPDDQIFYKKLKQIWDGHLIENILLTGENDGIDD